MPRHLETEASNKSLQLTVGRRTASLFFMKTRPLQTTLVDSFAPAQSPLPSRQYRLPRGFPARGVLASGS
jgi:hypothetical protein